MKHPIEISPELWIISAVSIILLCILMLISGIDIGEGNIRCEAVKNGVAEYVADKDGKSQFKWKSVKIVVEDNKK